MLIINTGLHLHPGGSGPSCSPLLCRIHPSSCSGEGLRIPALLTSTCGRLESSSWNIWAVEILHGLSSGVWMGGPESSAGLGPGKARYWALGRARVRHEGRILNELLLATRSAYLLPVASIGWWWSSLYVTPTCFCFLFCRCPDLSTSLPTTPCACTSEASLL